MNEIETLYEKVHLFIPHCPQLHLYRPGQELACLLLRHPLRWHDRQHRLFPKGAGLDQLPSSRRHTGHPCGTHLTAPLQLRSNITIHMGEGALFVPIEDYIFSAENVKNVELCGKGVDDNFQASKYLKIKNGCYNIYCQRKRCGRTAL